MQHLDSLKHFFRENSSLIVFLLLMLASRSSLADWYVVPSGSMQPTIVEGDRILVNKMAYRLELPFTDIPLMNTGLPERGDIIVFNSDKADTRLVKRIIGLPGDSVAMQDNELIINGEVLRYTPGDTSLQRIEHLEGAAHGIQILPRFNAIDSFPRVIVPEGHYLVLGDNRNNSSDSRVYGFVPGSELQGKVLRVLVSLNAEGFYLPRPERSLLPLG